MNSLAMFEFTEEDLKSNKRGFFSASQKEMIKNIADGTRSSQWGGMKVVMGFLIFGLCIILSMFLSVESYRTALFSDPSILIALVMIVPVVLGIFVLSIFWSYRRANQLLNSKLKKAEGVVRLDESHSSEVGSTYYAIIGKIKFSFPEEISGAFPEGKTYRIFYCETSMLKYILSFEKID